MKKTANLTARKRVRCMFLKTNKQIRSNCTK